jgi:hypothetical protein
MVGLAVDIGSDGSVTVEGQPVEATLTSGALTLEGGGVGPVSVPVRLDRYLPCAPEATVAEEQVTLTCVTDTLPPIVNRVLGEASDRLRNG